VLAMPKLPEPDRNCPVCDRPLWPGNFHTHGDVQPPLLPGWTRCVCGQPVIDSYNGWKEHTPWCPLKDGLSVPVRRAEPSA
jgi:hypothetical protein